MRYPVFPESSIPSLATDILGSRRYRNGNGISGSEACTNVPDAETWCICARGEEVVRMRGKEG